MLTSYSLQYHYPLSLFFNSRQPSSIPPCSYVNKNTKKRVYGNSHYSQFHEKKPDWNPIKQGTLNRTSCLVCPFGVDFLFWLPLSCRWVHNLCLTETYIKQICNKYRITWRFGTAQYKNRSTQNSAVNFCRKCCLSTLCQFLSGVDRLKIW